MIAIRRNDNVIQKIILTDKTIVRNSNGLVAGSALKIGDRVTQVINEGEIASLVLICGMAAAK